MTLDQHRLSECQTMRWGRDCPEAHAPEDVARPHSSSAINTHTVCTCHHASDEHASERCFGLPPIYGTAGNPVPCACQWNGTDDGIIGPDHE